MIEDRGWYNTEKPGEYKGIEAVQLVGAMSHPGGGRNDIPSRLKGHFDIFNVELPCEASVERIFGAIVEGHFCRERKFTESVIIEARRLTAMTQVRAFPPPSALCF